MRLHLSPLFSLLAVHNNRSRVPPLSATISCHSSCRHLSDHCGAGMLMSSSTSTSSSSAVTTRPPSTTSLAASMVPVPPSVTAACVGFFTGIRIPATLVAGSSLATVFALSDNVKDTSSMSRVKIFFYRIHHILALYALCLSLSSVLTSTTATTLLLLSEQATIHKSAARTIDAYSFLKTAMPFEFYYTRWSFLVSILLFFGSTMTRLLLEFDLFKGGRRVAGLGVFCLLVGIQSFMISYVNTSQHCFQSLWGLTKEVGKIIWLKAMTNRQPMMIVSVTCFVLAALFGVVFLLPTSIEHDQLADSDRYT